jgi:hypothetical protein
VTQHLAGSQFRLESLIFQLQIVSIKHWIVFILLGIYGLIVLWIKIGVRKSVHGSRGISNAVWCVAGVAIAVFIKPNGRDSRTWRTFAIWDNQPGYPLFYFMGEQSIDSAVASILNATVPLFISSSLITGARRQDDSPKVVAY